VAQNTIETIRTLRGTVRVPGDKSISHRAVILGALSSGKTRISNFCSGDDTSRTVQAFRSLGVSAETDGSDVLIWGKGITALQEPPDVLDLGNSGTTTRLMAGVLSGQPFLSVLTGDASLRSRPMRRVVAPLRLMGATIDGRKSGDYAPLTIRGRRLAPLHYDLPVASAQVKSALLLAALYAEGVTCLTEPSETRDHTERMLKAAGALIECEGTLIRIEGGAELQPLDVHVPGDISSASFLLVAASIVPESEIVISDVGINPTRTGVLDVLRQMGADIEISHVKERDGEPRADLTVRRAELRGTTIEGPLIPRTIDELPVLAIAAAFAQGTTILRDAQELRIKESDRISALVDGLRAMGSQVEESPDGMVIAGREKLQGAKVRSYGDHRIAMAFAVAGLAASGQTIIDDTDAVLTSYPEFFETLRFLSV